VAAGCHVWTSVRPRSDVQPGGPPVCLKLGVEACTEHVRCAELPWFPNGYGWQLSAPRRELAMYSLLGRIRSFIQDARAAGRLNRQEAGSMLPPLLLDVRPGHAVLDMCAAPGSKTVLLLDLLRHRGGAAGNGGAAGGAWYPRCNARVAGRTSHRGAPVPNSPPAGVTAESKLAGCSVRGRSTRTPRPAACPLPLGRGLTMVRGAMRRGGVKTATVSARDTSRGVRLAARAKHAHPHTLRRAEVEVTQESRDAAERAKIRRLAL